ncbi:anaerobic ribonucleoside-triphosphate reductase activating protein [Pistricoccus aurantiacus]|uniref:Anaerobic ribonucleoside-triphosphate reductase activating protein n=1 Tax=Pistricoccus aurantiacus TaxID=1883414 RepID=A0A5B8SSH5_9GAMM|nr:anaerobic ribonucleoside-triphosphate reductase activating protein [Pistricoccus aurantiacus]QEA38425.1 anaerobic ribonucleoside-triphosphate reductase activating protein [Pistricoccus aurantiacus]
MSRAARREPSSRHLPLIDRAAIRLPVAGLVPLTSLDYPEHLACVVFLQGCPLRCGYCHNPQMITPRRGKPQEWAEIREFLQSRRGLLDGVVFSGGEPTLHGDLLPAMREARAMGFKVGLHTAGIYPKRLEALLPWLDWVGLDVKGYLDDFERITGRRGAGRRHAHSLALLLDSGIDLECRTTIHWRDFTLTDVERLALSLADCGVDHYALQLARTDQCLDRSYCQPVENAPTREMIERLLRRLRPHFTHLTLRD